MENYPKTKRRRRFDTEWMKFRDAGSMTCCICGDWIFEDQEHGYIAELGEDAEEAHQSCIVEYAQTLIETREEE